MLPGTDAEVEVRWTLPEPWRPPSSPKAWHGDLRSNVEGVLMQTVPLLGVPEPTGSAAALGILCWLASYPAGLTSLILALARAPRSALVAAVVTYALVVARVLASLVYNVGGRWAVSVPVTMWPFAVFLGLPLITATAGVVLAAIRRRPRSQVRGFPCDAASGDCPDGSRAGDPVASEDSSDTRRADESACAGRSPTRPGPPQRGGTE